MARTAYFDGYSYGAVNQSAKTQVVSFTCSWDYNAADDHVRVGFMVGTGNPPSGTIYWYDIISGKSPGYWRDGSSYSSGGPETCAYDGGTTGSLARGPELTCDQTYYVNSRVTYWADYDETSANARTSATSSLKTYAISVTAPTLSSSSVGETTATITANPYYVNTLTSLCTATLQYKKSADADWTTAESASSLSGYDAKSISKALTGLTAGTTYQYRLVITRATANETSYASSTGTFTTTNPSPTVTTNAATSVTSYSATLQGTTDPNSITVYYYFQYGTTSGAYTTDTTVQGPSSSADPLNFSHALSGLSASTPYYYRAVTVRQYGTGDPIYYYGAEVSFTTSAAPSVPEVNTQAATSVGSTTATLNGSVHPHAIATTYYFQYYKDGGTAWASSTASQGPSSADALFSFSADISGLDESSLYHFRAVAAYAGPTYVYGTSFDFTTGASAATIAKEEGLDSTSQFEGTYGVAKLIPFHLLLPADSSCDVYYTSTAPVQADVLVYKDGVYDSTADNAPVSLGNGLYILTLSATEMTCTTVDVIIHDATNPHAFRDAHIQVFTKRLLGQIDIDATGFGGNAHAVSLTAHGSGYSLNCADDISTGETLTVGGDLAVVGNMAVVDDITVDDVTVADDFAISGDLTAALATIAGALTAGSWAGPFTGSLLTTGTVVSAGGYAVALASTASGLNDFYVGCAIAIVSGTGEGQFRLIESYDGSSKTATVNRSWSTLPSSNSVYLILPSAEMWGSAPSGELLALPSTLSFYGDKLQWLFQRFFFPREQRRDGGLGTDLTFTMFQEDGTTALGTQDVTDAGNETGTHTVAKMS